MAKLTKADAARHLGISRTTLYKLIDQGKLSAVAYLGAADNVSRLLPSLLSDIPQPVIRSRNLFSRLHPVRLVYL